MVLQSALALDEVVGFEDGVDTRSVKADDDITTDVEYGDAALAGLLDGLHAGRRLFIDIDILVGYAFVIEIAHGSVTKGAPFCPINDNLWISHSTVIVALYIVKSPVFECI